jgi:hypothetical protein
VTFEAPAALGYPDENLYIFVEDPSITVTSRSQFGKFSEVTFTSTRKNKLTQLEIDQANI